MNKIFPWEQKSKAGKLDAQIALRQYETDLTLDIWKSNLIIQKTETYSRTDRIVRFLTSKIYRREKNVQSF